jgi:hypothetical protein
VKHARLFWTMVAVVAMATWVTAFACEDKAAKASARAKGAAVTAAMEGCSAHKTAAAAAATEGCAGHKSAKAAMAAAGAEGCMHGNKNTAASAAGMCSQAKGVSAGMPGCAHGAGAMTDMCAGHKTASAMAHADMDCAHCASCTDMANCEKELDAAGAVIQVVRLKNGVMYVYTADAPGRVRTVQSAIARRGDEWTKLAVAGNGAKLCPPCKEMRGAAASGKLSRETVNIEGGCMTLLTSSDPGVVKRIYEMAGISNGNRTKS